MLDRTATLERIADLATQLRELERDLATAPDAEMMEYRLERVRRKLDTALEDLRTLERGETALWLTGRR